MADFKTALIALANGELSDQVVADNIGKILTKHPSLAVEIMEQLNDAYAVGIIEAATFSKFKALVKELSSPDDPSRAIADEARAALADDGDLDLVIDFDLSPTTENPLPEKATADPAERDADHTDNETSWPHEPVRAAKAAIEEEKIGPGSVLKERFQLDEILGVGGMGTVFRGRDLIKVEARDKNPYVALKVLNEDFKQHPDAFIALQREASRQQKLAHPNITTVYDFDRTAAGTFFLTMELLEGAPLNTFIKKTVKPKGGLPFEEAYPMIEGLGKALIYAHERDIVHSDFKPGNCFITKDDTMKVLDFGIARAVKTPGAADTEKTIFDPGKLGALTPPYASTEMLEEKEPDTRDDIYALACVAYELLSGKHPFNKLRATAARDNNLIPAPIKSLKRRQMKALQKGLGFTREERSQTVAEFLADLRGSPSPFTNPWVTIPSVVVILTAVGIFPLINLVQEREISRYIESLRSGEQQRIASTLSSLAKDNVAPEMRDRIMVTTRPEILGYFEKRINELVDPERGMHDFTGARKIIDDVSNISVFSDSAQVVAWRNKIDDAERSIINEQLEAFNEALIYGRLLNVDDEQDIHDILEAVTEIKPALVETLNSRLPGAYAAAIERAIVNEEFERAVSLSQAGLKILPNHQYIINLSEKISGAQERAQMEADIMRNAAAIQDAIAVANRIGDFYPIQNAVRSLSFIDSKNILLAKLRTAVAPLVEEEIQRLETSPEPGASDLLSRDFTPLLMSLNLTTLGHKIITLQNAFDAKIETSIKRIRTVLSDNPANEQSIIRDLLSDLNRFAPEHPRTLEAEETVARWIVNQARALRTSGRFSEAESQLASGRLLLGNSTHVALLNEERQIIAALKNDNAVHYVQNSAAQKKQFDTIADDLIKILDEPVLDLVSIETSLATFDQLRATDPSSNRTPRFEKNLIQDVIDASKALSVEQNWSEATMALQRLLVFLPLAQEAQSELISISQHNQQTREHQRSAQIETLNADLGTLLAEPAGDRVWNNRVLQSMIDLQGLVGPDNDRLVEIKERIARSYLEKARGSRAQGRLAESQNVIARGKIYAPDLVGFRTEQLALDAAMEKLLLTQRQNEREAYISGLKQEFMTQTEAGDVESATKSFARLRIELAPDNQFIADQAPNMLANSYLKLAENAARADDFAKALTLVKTGLAALPASNALRVAVKNYSVRGNSQSLGRTFARGGDFNLDVVLDQIAEIQQLDPAYYGKNETAWSVAIAERIQRLKQLRGSKSNELLLKAQSIFAGNTLIESIASTSELALDAPMVVHEIREAMDNARLGKTRDLLQSVDPTDRDHTAVVQLQNLFDEKIKQAKQHYEEYKVAFNSKNLALAQDKIEQALTIWRDNNTFKQEYERLSAMSMQAPSVSANEFESPQPPSSDAPCREKLAGDGKRSDATCYDMVSATARGPLLVVVPSGANFNNPFAIGKYEITVGDFNTYCRESGACNIALDIDINLPKTQISHTEAVGYANWLSEKTGNKYRLPRVDEWRYAARAAGQQPRKDYNCRVEQGGEILKGNAPVDMAAGKANGWGLYNYIGNVQEWATSESTVQALGGSYLDRFDDCDVNLMKDHSGAPDGATGFRIVREM